MGWCGIKEDPVQEQITGGGQHSTSTFVDNAEEKLCNVPRMTCTCQPGHLLDMELSMSASGADWLTDTFSGRPKKGHSIEVLEIPDEPNEPT